MVDFREWARVGRLRSSVQLAAVVVAVAAVAAANLEGVFIFERNAIPLSRLFFFFFLINLTAAH